MDPIYMDLHPPSLARRPSVRLSAPRPPGGYGVERPSLGALCRGPHGHPAANSGRSVFCGGGEVMGGLG